MAKRIFHHKYFMKLIYFQCDNERLCCVLSACNQPNCTYTYFWCILKWNNVEDPQDYCHYFNAICCFFLFVYSIGGRLNEDDTFIHVSYLCWIVYIHVPLAENVSLIQIVLMYTLSWLQRLGRLCDNINFVSLNTLYI